MRFARLRKALPAGPVAAARPRAVVAFAFAFVLVAAAVPDAVAQSTREQLVVLIDRSPSMRSKDAAPAAPGGRRRSRYEAAVEAAMDEVGVSLRSGVAVRIVPYDEVPRDASRLFAPAPADVDRDLAEVREFFGDTSRLRRLGITRTWRSVDQLLDGALLAGQYTRLSLYSDDETADRADESRVLRRLQERWELKDIKQVSLRIRRWSVGQSPVSAGVAYNFPPDRPELPTLGPGDFKGGVCELAVPVRAIFSGNAGPGDAVELSRVTVVPAEPNTPPLRVVASGTDRAGGLTTANPGGVVRLRLERGPFPAARVSDRYELRLEFSLAGRSVPVPEPLLVLVASKPSVRIVPERDVVSLHPGAHEDVPVRLSGQDAAGQVVKLAHRSRSGPGCP